MTAHLGQFDPLEFLTVAERLALGSTQGEWRTAAGRSYYAVFLRARELLISIGAVALSASGQDHGTVLRGIRARLALQRRSAQEYRSATLYWSIRWRPESPIGRLRCGTPARP